MYRRAICGLLGFAVSFSAASTVPAHAQVAVPQQVTSSYNLDLVPSPDGHSSVMITIVGGREQLFLREDEKARWIQITKDDADHEDPAWSPDGRQIAFVLTNGESRVVYVMNRNGSAKRPITPSDVRAIHPSWTPDGKRLLYSTDDDVSPPAKNASTIHEVDLETGKIKSLVTGGVNTFPVMSPDGRKIAFRRIIQENNSEIFVANSDGSIPQNVTRHPSFEGWPQWSPDGAQIAFAANRNGQDFQIFHMRPDGSNIRLIAETRGRATSPKWSADGKAVFFTNCRSADGVRGCDIYSASIP